MRKFTKAVLLGATLIAAAFAAPSLYADDAPTQTHSKSGSAKDQGMMGNGQHGMMGGGNQGQSGMMEGNGGMKGMMGMMAQMSKMMETCNTMMQSHMEHHGGDQPNGQKQAPATPNKG